MAAFVEIPETDRFVIVDLDRILKIEMGATTSDPIMLHFSDDVVFRIKPEFYESHIRPYVTSHWASGKKDSTSPLDPALLAELSQLSPPELIALAGQIARARKQ